jgi:SAM-dependent methyltransferase
LSGRKQGQHSNANQAISGKQDQAMSEQLAAKTHAATENASLWVQRFVDLIPAGGEVLDLACGSGRHAHLLAAHGHPVLALDRDAGALALAAGNGITTLQLDLEAGEETDSQKRWPFAANRFAAIIVTNYLHRPLWPQIIASLADGGVLLYETFAEGNAQFGKPSNPAFLLKCGELLQVAHDHGLRILAFEDGYVSRPKAAMVQRICARKPGDAVFPAQNLQLN